MNLDQVTTDELRAEVRRRGFELHSVRFSQAAQNALRELEGLRRRIDELMVRLREADEGQVWRLDRAAVPDTLKSSSID